MSKRHREGAEIRSGVYDTKARQTQFSVDYLESENGPVHPVCSIRRVERNVGELMQRHVLLQDKCGGGLGHSEDDRELFPEFLSS